MSERRESLLWFSKILVVVKEDDTPLLAREDIFAKNRVDKKSNKQQS